MKCPKCEKQNKPGVKNCEFCNEIMPVRKKRETSKKITESSDKKIVKNKTNNKNEVTKNIKKTSSKKTIEEKIEKEPIIELSEEKKALKKMMKKAKKINKMIFVYIFLVVSLLAIIVMFNNKMHTITCQINNNSETEKYSIKVLIKRNKEKITGFKYITESITNSYDETLKSRYEIILDDLKKKDDFENIVSSKLNNRSWKIIYNFRQDYLDKTSDYIGIDLEPYYDNVDMFVEELEKEVGFSCK